MFYRELVTPVLTYGMRDRGSEMYVYHNAPFYVYHNAPFEPRDKSSKVSYCTL